MKGVKPGHRETGCCEKQLAFLNQGKKMKSFTKTLTMLILISALLPSGIAWAFDSSILNPNWRPGAADSTAPSASQPASPNLDQPTTPPSPNGTNLFKDPNFNDLIQSPSSITPNPNVSGNSSSQQAQNSPQSPGNKNNNQKGKFGLLATLVCMGALFPISSAIRNIMMGFLTWLGVNEEKTARQMAGTLSGLVSVSHLAGSGLNSIVGGNSSFNKSISNSPGGNVGSKVPPIGGGVGFSGSAAGGPGALGGMAGRAGNVAGTINGVTTENSSNAVNVPGGTTGGSGLAGSGKSTVSGGPSSGSFSAGNVKSPGLSGPDSIGVGKIEESGSPLGGDTGIGGSLPAAEVNPLPSEASYTIDGAPGKGALASEKGMAPLYKDMLQVDNRSRKLYNVTAQAASVADGFAPGSSKLLAATVSNLASVPMAISQVAKGVSQIKREGNMSFRDAVKMYTNSNNLGTGMAKMAGGIAGSAAGMGPFGVTAVGTSINVAGKTKDYTVAGGRVLYRGVHKIGKSIFS